MVKIGAFFHEEIHFLQIYNYEDQDGNFYFVVYTS